MLLATNDSVPGWQIVESLGMVRGNAVRARNVVFDITAFLRNIVGGNVPEYSDLLARSRDEATNRMVSEAEKLGADAIIEVRYATAQIAAGMAEILAYGTAVRLAK